MLLQTATKGNAAINIPAPKTLELFLIHNPYKMPAGYYGPIPKSTVGLLLGQSNYTILGLIVHTGVINKDYQVKISLMLHVTSLMLHPKS